MTTNPPPTHQSSDSPGEESIAEMLYKTSADEQVKPNPMPAQSTVADSTEEDNLLDNLLQKLSLRMSIETKHEEPIAEPELEMQPIPESLLAAAEPVERKPIPALNTKKEPAAGPAVALAATPSFVASAIAHVITTEKGTPDLLPKPDELLFEGCMIEDVSAVEEDGSCLCRATVEGADAWLRLSTKKDRTEFYRQARALSWLNESCLPRISFAQDKYLIELIAQAAPLTEWRGEQVRLDPYRIGRIIQSILRVLYQLQASELCIAGMDIDHCVVTSEGEFKLNKLNTVALSQAALRSQRENLAKIFYYLIRGERVSIGSLEQPLSEDDSHSEYPLFIRQPLDRSLQGEDEYEESELLCSMDQWMGSNQAPSHALLAHEKHRYSSNKPRLRIVMSIIAATIFIAVLIIAGASFGMKSVEDESEQLRISEELKRSLIVDQSIQKNWEQKIKLPSNVIAEEPLMKGATVPIFVDWSSAGTGLLDSDKFVTDETDEAK